MRLFLAPHGVVNSMMAYGLLYVSIQHLNTCNNNIQSSSNNDYSFAKNNNLELYLKFR
jgi:hypothetical protein